MAVRFSQEERQEILGAIQSEVSQGSSIQKAIKKHKISYGTYNAWRKKGISAEPVQQSVQEGSDLANILFDLKSRLKREVVNELVEHLRKFTQ